MPIVEPKRKKQLLPKHPALGVAFVAALGALTALGLYNFFSGADYKAAYARISLPSNLSNQTCTFDPLPGDTPQRSLVCGARFTSSISEETSLVAASLNAAGYTLVKYEVSQNGPPLTKPTGDDPNVGSIWAQNGTWIVEILIDGRVINGRSDNAYGATFENGSSFSQFD